MAKKKEYAVMGRMHNPAHPGQVLKTMHLAPLGLTVTEAAARLDIDRKTLSRIINGRMGITVDMALRLNKALKTSAELWLGMQQAYDIWQARHNKKYDLSRVKTLRLDHDQCAHP